MKKGIIAGVITLMLAAGAVWLFGGFAASGLTPPKAAQINDASIIIGTYLIDFAVLNEENQTLAEENAAATSQSKVYYKSDINKGVWYDITDAENVGDISLKNSKIVTNSVIDALTITMYFKADGTIIDYTTGGTTTAQDILTTVYPSNMTELGNLVQQRNIVASLVEAEKDKDKKEVYSEEKYAIEVVLYVIDNEIVRGYAKELAALDKSIKALKTQQAVDAVVKVKLVKEAEHDIYCCNVVISRLNNVTEWLAKLNMTAHSSLISTMNDTITELNGTISNLSAAAGTTESSSNDAKEKLADEITAAAIAGDSSALNAAAEKLDLLEAVIDGDECDNNAAAALLEEMLTDLTDSISDEVASILNNTHPFYTGETDASDLVLSDDVMPSLPEPSATTTEDTDGIGDETSTDQTSADVTEDTVSDSEAEVVKPTTDEVVSAINQKIGDAQAYIEDIAMRLTGSTDSDEANKLKAEKYSVLGAQLETLADSEATDDLQKKLLELLSEKSAETLDNAATAEALSDSALSQGISDIDGMEAAADAKYEEYIDALEKGDTALAAVLKKELDSLNDTLDAARSGSDISSLYAALADAKAAAAKDSTDKDAAKAVREAKAALAAAEKLLSGTDSLLLGELDTALSELEEACASGAGETARECLDNMVNAMSNLDADLLGDSTKSKILAFATAALQDAGKQSAANGDSYNGNALVALSEDAAALSAEALSGSLGTDGSRNSVSNALSALLSAKGKVNSSEAKANAEEQKLSDVEKILAVEGERLTDEQNSLLDAVQKCVERVEGAADSGDANTVRSACTELSTLLADADFEVFGSSARTELLDYLDKLIDFTAIVADDEEGIAKLLSDAREALRPIKTNDGGSGVESGASEVLAAVYDAKAALLDANGAKDEAEKALSEAETALRGESGVKPLTDALTALENATEIGNPNAVGTAYTALLQALDNLPSETVDETAKTDIINYADGIVAAAADALRENGDGETANSLENALADAKNGEDDTSDIADVIGGELYAYKLIAADYGIYSNTMTLTVGKTTYIKILDAARAAGGSVITADGVYVIKGENLLIEFSLGSATAYVGDKLYALGDSPFESDGSVYAPLDLFAKGYSLTQTEENGTIFLRKE